MTGRRAPALVGLLALGAVVTLAAVAAGWPAGSPPPDHSSSSPASTPPPAGSPVLPEDWAWTRADEAVFDGSNSVHDLSSDGRTLVALGQACERNESGLTGPCWGVTWTLEDEVWSRPVPVGADRSANFNAILIDGETRLVASSGGSSSVWAWRGSLGWQPIADQAPFAPEADGGPTGAGLPEAFLGAEIAALAGGPAGFVAVGRVSCGQCGMGDRAAVWLSADGEAWQRLPYEPPFKEGSMWDLTRFGDELIVVGVGIWRSPDGLAWERIRGAGGLLSSVTVGGPGLVAVGYDGSNGTLAGVSTDGLEWQSVAIEPGNGVSLEGVASSAYGLFAVGRPIGPDRGLIWWSADGFDWHLLDTGGTFADAILRDVVAHRDAIYVSGTVRNGYPDQAGAVWVGRPGGP